MVIIERAKSWTALGACTWPLVILARSLGGVTLELRCCRWLWRWHPAQWWHLPEAFHLRRLSRRCQAADCSLRGCSRHTTSGWAVRGRWPTARRTAGAGRHRRSARACWAAALAFEPADRGERSDGLTSAVECVFRGHCAVAAALAAYTPHTRAAAPPSLQLQLLPQRVILRRKLRELGPMSLRLSPLSQPRARQLGGSIRARHLARGRLLPAAHICAYGISPHLGAALNRAPVCRRRAVTIGGATRASLRQTCVLTGS